MVLYYHTSHSIMIHLHIFDDVLEGASAVVSCVSLFQEVHLRVRSSSLMYSVMIESVHVSLDDILYTCIPQF